MKHWAAFVFVKMCPPLGHFRRIAQRVRTGNLKGHNRENGFEIRELFPRPPRPAYCPLVGGAKAELDQPGLGSRGATSKRRVVRIASEAADGGMPPRFMAGCMGASSTRWMRRLE